MINPQVRISMVAEVQRIAKITSPTKCGREWAKFQERYGSQISGDEMVDFLDDMAEKGIPENPINPVDPVNPVM